MTFFSKYLIAGLVIGALLGLYLGVAMAHTPPRGGPTYEKLRVAQQLKEKTTPPAAKRYIPRKLSAMSKKEQRMQYIAVAKAMQWKYALPRHLLVSVCEQESRWNPTALSNKGAVGICQIMPGTFKRLIRSYQHDNGLRVDGAIGPLTWGVMRPGVPFVYKTNMQRLYTANENIEWAAYYLRWILDNVTTDPAIVLAVYYAGQNHQVVRYMLEVSERIDNARREYD